MSDLPAGMDRALQATATLTIAEVWNEGMASANDDSAFPFAQILEAMDQRTCALCESVDGMIVAVPSAEYDEWRQPSHVNCFPAGTVVCGSAVRESSSRWYSGEIVEIRTVNGHFLTVTPNHPMLTPEGWVAAGLLHEGSYVISSRRPERVGPTIDPYDHQVPALIEEVAKSLGGSLPVASRRVPVSAEDFHGDGEGSEVCIIRSHGPLRQEVDTPFLQPALKLSLQRGGMGLPFLTSGRAHASLLQGPDATLNGRMGGLGVPRVFFRAPRCHHQDVRLRVAPKRYAGGFEASADHDTIDGVFGGKRAHRLAGLILRGYFFDRKPTTGATLGGTQGMTESGLLDRRSEQPSLNEGLAQTQLPYVELLGSVLAAVAGEVSSDRVLKIRRRRFSGHVYNLQTATGWYVANGIIAHNCRRVLAYISRDESGVKATFERPPEKLIEEHGHYHIDPEAKAEFRSPAQPAGRNFIVHEIENPETGETKRWLEWAPWHDQLTKAQKQLILDARRTTTPEALKPVLEKLGITDPADPEQQRKLVLYGLRDRVEGWVTKTDAKRAKTLGLELPEAWKADGDKEPDEDKAPATTLDMETQR